MIPQGSIVVDITRFEGDNTTGGNKQMVYIMQEMGWCVLYRRGMSYFKSKNTNSILTQASVQLDPATFAAYGAYSQIRSKRVKKSY